MYFMPPAPQAALLQQQQQQQQSALLPPPPPPPGMMADSINATAPPSYDAVMQDPNAPRSQTNLFVRRLASAVTEADMKKLFVPHGNILSFALMRDIHTGESLGTAFVRFETHEQAKKAMSALDGTELYGRAISIQWAKKQHDGAPVGEARRRIHKLFVRNVPVDVSARRLRQLFSPYGSINNVTLHADTAPLPTNSPATTSVGGTTSSASADGEPAQERNIAFILFNEDGAAEKAVNGLHNTCPFDSCKGIPLMVKLAEDNRQRLERKAKYGETSPGAAALLPSGHSTMMITPPNGSLQLTPAIFTGSAQTDSPSTGALSPGLSATLHSRPVNPPAFGQPAAAGPMHSFMYSTISPGASGVLPAPTGAYMFPTATTASQPQQPQAMPHAAPGGGAATVDALGLAQVAAYQQYLQALSPFYSYLDSGVALLHQQQQAQAQAQQMAANAYALQQSQMLASPYAMAALQQQQQQQQMGGALYVHPSSQPPQQQQQQPQQRYSLVPITPPTATVPTVTAEGVSASPANSLGSNPSATGIVLAPRPGEEHILQQMRRASLEAAAAAAAAASRASLAGTPPEGTVQSSSLLMGASNSAASGMKQSPQLVAPNVAVVSADGTAVNMAAVVNGGASHADAMFVSGYKVGA